MANEEAEEPDIGLVILQVYVWRNEQPKDRQQSRKARPCLIVHKRQNEYDETEVFICPVTHIPPRNPAQAKEIPLATRQRLQLDDDQSWVITSEVNRFIWPGSDLEKTPAGKPAFGYLPHNMVKATIRQVQENAR